MVRRRDDDRDGIDAVFHDQLFVIGNPPRAALFGHRLARRGIRLGDGDQLARVEFRENAGVMASERANSDDGQSEAVHAALRCVCSVVSSAAG